MSRKRVSPSVSPGNVRPLQEQSRRREVSGSRGRRGSALVARRARPAIIGPFRMTTPYLSGLFGRLWFSGAMGRVYGFSQKTTTKFENLGSKEGVDTVHTLRLELPRTVLGLLRLPHVFTRSQCFQGQECNSSPTSGTAYPLVRGVFALTCVQSLRWRPSESGFVAVASPPRGLFKCVGGGFSALAGGLSACCGCLSHFLLSILSGRSAWPAPIHGSGEWGRHDLRDFDTRPSGARSQRCGGVLWPSFVQSKGVWTLSTLTSDLMLCPALAGTSGTRMPACRDLARGRLDERVLDSALCRSSRGSNSRNAGG
jgi:hypothetical protein